MEKHLIHVSNKPVLRSTIGGITTVATSASPIAVGWAIGSPAMQWFGFVISIILLFSIASGKVKYTTIAGAREYLDSLEAPESGK